MHDLDLRSKCVVQENVNSCVYIIISCWELGSPFVNWIYDSLEFMNQNQLNHDSFFWCPMKGNALPGVSFIKSPSGCNRNQSLDETWESECNGRVLMWGEASKQLQVQNRHMLPGILPAAKMPGESRQQHGVILPIRNKVAQGIFQVPHRHLGSICCCSWW